MSVNLEKRSNHCLISVESPFLGGDEAMKLKESALKIIDSGEKNLTLDLRKTEKIDSSGIGKLLFLNKKMKMTGGTFLIININRTLYCFLYSLAITERISISTKHFGSDFDKNN